MTLSNVTLSINNPEDRFSIHRPNPIFSSLLQDGILVVAIPPGILPCQGPWPPKGDGFDNMEEVEADV